MTDVRETGLNVFRELMPGLLPDGDVDFGSSGLAGELFEISIENVFGRLWGREGLSRRDRSLVTLGLLIALRSTDELGIHFQDCANQRPDRRGDLGDHLPLQRIRRLPRRGHRKQNRPRSAQPVVRATHAQRAASVREMPEKCGVSGCRRARSRRLQEPLRSHLGESNS